MRLAVLVLEVGRASGPDLTRYLVVCAGSIAGLLGLAWVFRRTLARHVRARAARRSLQVLDVLPLSGKQKLVVVRCYDRSFLLGLGEKEVRAIAELESAAGPPEALARLPFEASLEQELVLRPPAPAPAAGGEAQRTLDPRTGVLA
jgi:flagellar biogenesis protein FliO